MSYLIVFCYGLILDTMYVIWMRCVNQERKWAASVASVGVAAPGLMGYVNVSRDLTYAIPYLAGLFFGTLAAMTFWPQKESE